VPSMTAVQHSILTSQIPDGLPDEQPYGDRLNGLHRQVGSAA
jgi:hypothetical protein